MITELDTLMERKRSDNYIRHAEALLRLAEEELVSAEGHMISIKGLTKLRDKLARIRAEKVKH